MDKVNKSKNISIAIDGPSASGKSTVAKKLASKLGYLYIDTGAMYRAYTLAVIRANLDPKNEEQSITLVNKIQINFDPISNHVLLDGEDVAKEIRSNIVADNVSYIASYKKIRLFLVDLQRKIAGDKNVIMDGRDIGTYVLKEASIKFFLVANVKERGKRRYLENIEKGISSTLEDSLENIKKRDYIDSHREFCPLEPAFDSIFIDSTNLTVSEVIEEMEKIIKEKKL